MLLKKGDLLVIFMLLAVALAFLGWRHFDTSAGERVLKIELDGELVEQVSFNEQTDDIVSVVLPGGYVAKVEIAAGKVRVLPMTKEACPLGICSSIGWVEHTGDAIVCMPNRLVITVLGGTKDEAWDAVDGVTN